MLFIVGHVERRRSFLESSQLLAPLPSPSSSTTPTPSSSSSWLSPSRLITSKTLSPIHDLINVFLFTIMLTQCVLHTLDLFYILSNRWSNLLQSCAHCSCSWHLASPSCCDRRQDHFEMQAELGRYAENQNGNLRWHLPLGVRPPPHNGRTVAPEAILFESPCRAHSET